VSGESRTIWVVRHAEKSAGLGLRDVELSPRGLARAEALPEVVPASTLRDIVVTRYRRTAQTAEAVARASGLAPTVIPANDVEGVVAHLHAVGGDALVVGHCDTVPMILAELGVTEAAVGLGRHAKDPAALERFVGDVVTALA